MHKTFLAKKKFNSNASEAEKLHCTENDLLQFAERLKKHEKLPMHFEQNFFLSESSNDFDIFGDSIKTTFVSRSEFEAALIILWRHKSGH